MDQYLSQQQQMVLYKDPNTITMDDFKQLVKKWFEIDNYMKQAQQVIKDKRKEKLQISQVIMAFMCKYNIEDLNTKEGRIRCKSVQVKTPLNKEFIKQQLIQYVKEETKREEVIQKIYEERETIEKTTLRRLKIS
jgi:hypothetical protein